MVLNLEICAGLCACADMTANGRKLRLDGVLDGWQGNDKGQAHGGGNQPVFNGRRTCVVVEKLFHLALRKFELTASSQRGALADMTCL
jgi:hypothetical protein